MEYFINPNYKTKFIFSLLSAIIYQLGSSVVVTIGNFSVYFVSYIHYKYEWVNMQYGNSMAPTILLLLAIFSPLSGLLEEKIGPRFTLLLSSIIVEICFILYYFQRDLFIFYTISFFIGIGNGISAGVPLKNVCRYYPKRKGLINSIIIFLGGLASSLYSFIGEKIINPSKKTIINKNTNPFYPLEVAERANSFFIFAMIVIPITTIISLFLFIKFEPDFKENSNENNENNENMIQKRKNDNITNTKEIMTSFRFWRNIIIISLMPFWIYFLTSTYRAYSPLLGIKQEIISDLPTIVTCISSIIGLSIGFSFDKFGFQNIIKIMSTITIISSIYFTIFINNKTLYIIGLLISTSVSRVGMMSVINPHIMNVFEFRNYLIIGGFARAFNQLSCFIAALTSVLISLNYKNSNASDLEAPYRIVASIGILLSSAGGLLLSFYENDEKFKFKNGQNNNEQNLGIDTSREIETEDDEQNHN